MPACVLMISYLSLWLILLGCLGQWLLRSTWLRVTHASLPPPGHLPHSPTAAPLPCGRAAFLDGRASLQDLHTPCRICSLCLQTFQVTFQIRVSPLTGELPPAGGLGPTFLDTAVTIQSSVRGAWVPGPSGTLDQNVFVMCPASLKWPPPLEQARSRVDWNYFWEGHWQKCSSTAQEPRILHSPRQDFVEQLK